jgi:hypothetical protein
MSHEFLGDRRKALEEAFFAKHNAALLVRLREAREKLNSFETLARASGIRDAAVLEKLVELGLDAASWTALSLVPLVEVAWADGVVEASERDAILAAAGAQGIAPGSASCALLENWLDTRPPAVLFATWGAYAVGIAAELDDHERALLRAEIVGRVRKIARMAGGALGARFSDAEKRAIAAIEKPFV